MVGKTLGVLFVLCLFLFCATPVVIRGGVLDDVTPPVTVPVFDPPSGCGWWTPGVTLTLTATDDESGVNVTYVQVDEEAWVVYTHCLSFGYEGWFVVRFYSVDNAGNVEDVKQVVVKIDATAPVTTAVLDPPNPDGENGWYVGNITVTLDAFDPAYGSGVNATYYRANGDPAWYLYTQPVVWYAGDTFECYSVDNVGNREGSKSIYFKFDREPPVVSLLVEPYRGGLNLIANCGDSTSGVDRVEFFYHGESLGSDSEAPYIYWYWPLNPPFHLTGIIFAPFIRGGSIAVFVGFAVLSVNVSASAVVYDNAGNHATATMIGMHSFWDHCNFFVVPNHVTGTLRHFYVNADFQ